MYWTSPNVLMVSPQSTEHPLMYSWYPPHASWYPSMYLWYPPDVLMISPRCTHDIPPMYSRYPPNILMVSPDVLNTPDVLNILQCTEHTLYRVLISMTETIRSTLDNGKYGCGEFRFFKLLFCQQKFDHGSDLFKTLKFFPYRNLQEGGSLD